MVVDRPASLLVVGFAGGAVCMSVQRYLPLARLTACDLDAIAQEKIAKRYFGESHMHRIVVSGTIELLQT
jgi:spermidine synthase